MKNSDMRAKARAIFGPAIAEPMPKQPNGAKALQQRANARPIPTYKVGGPVKKPMPTPADRAAAKMQDEMLKKAKVTKRETDTLASANRSEGGYKKGGKVQTSSDTARKLASEMGGMKKGGKPKDGLAVMIAIGKTKPIKEKATGEMYASKAAMKKHEAKESAAMERAERMKPMKKMNGGSMAARDMDMEAAKVTRAMGYAAGGAGKMRKGQAPMKKAQGGAAKVRKGMMSEKGDILEPVKPKRGLGESY